MFLGIDISRADVATVLAHADGSVAMALRTPLPLDSDSLQTWKIAAETAHETLIRSQIERRLVKNVALALDANFDQNGVVQKSVWAEGWHGFDIPNALRETLSIENARAASRIWCESLGEERFGALRSAEANWLYLHVGARLGAVASQSSSLQSSTRNELDWGEICVERDGVLGSSGRRGTLEAYCTNSNFLARAAGYGITFPNAAEVWAQVENNFAARSLCDDYLRRLAQGIGNAVSLLRPQKIVIGGSLPESLGETLLQPLRSTLREFCAFPAELVLSATQLSRDGAVWGAVALAMQENKAS